MLPRRHIFLTAPRLRRAITYTVSLVVASGYAMAQTEETRRLKPVDVTQSRIGADPAAPFALDILTSEDIAIRQARTMPEALKGLAGVQVQKTANGHGSPYIRGFTGNRTLALIDGIRYNNATYRDGANEYFSHIDITSIETIELLRGASSILYGSEAVGGALNLKTSSAFALQNQTGNSPFSGNIGVRVSSAEQSQSVNGQVHTGSKGKWAALIGGSAKSFGNVIAADLGTLPGTGYSETAQHFRLDVNLTQNWALTALHQRFKQDDVGRTHSTQDAVSFAGTRIGTDQRRTKDQSRELTYLRLNGDANTPLFDMATLTLSHQPHKDAEIRIRDDGRRIDAAFTANTTGLDLSLARNFGNGHLRYGASYYADDIDSSRTDTSTDGQTITQQVQGPIGDDATYTHAGVFAQWEHTLYDRLDIIAGARLSAIKADIGAYRDPLTGNADSYSGSWQDASFAIRSSYALTPMRDQFLWASISESFRAPNIADLSRFGKSRSDEIESTAIGLSPEQFLTTELGWRWQGNTRALDVTAFHTDISDYIGTAPTGRSIDGLIEVSKQNLSQGFVHGIDVSGSLNLSNSLSATFSAAWIEGELTAPRNGTTTAQTYEPLSRIAPPAARLGLIWRPAHGNWYAGGEVSATGHANHLSSGDASDSERIPPGGTPSYVLFNTFGGLSLNDHIDLTLRLENMSDAAYRTHGSGSNEPGFNAILGLSARF